MIALYVNIIGQANMLKHINCKDFIMSTSR